MFRSIADQLGVGDQRGSKGHETVRASVVKYMRQNRDVFAAFVEDDEGLDAYLDRMRYPATATIRNVVIMKV
jgi:hypothetical protein